jgi:zinc protease
MTKPFLHAAAVVLALVVAPLGRSGSAQTPLPTARSIVDRYVTAMGGEAAFAKVISVHATGRVEIPQQGISGTADVVTARPNKSRLVVEIAGIGRIETGYDGKVGWNIDPQSGPTLAVGDELVEMAETDWFDSPLREPDHVKEMTTVEKTTFDDRPAYKVRIVFPSGREEFSYFDVESGLDLGHEGKRATRMGSLPSTELFRDYKTFGDVKQATSIVARVLGLEQVVHIDTCVYNTVTPDAFDLPPAIKALIKGQ